MYIALRHKLFVLICVIRAQNKMKYTKKLICTHNRWTCRQQRSANLQRKYVQKVFVISPLCLFVTGHNSQVPVTGGVQYDPLHRNDKQPA